MITEHQLRRALEDELRERAINLLGPYARWREASLAVGESTERLRTEPGRDDGIANDA